MAVLPASGQEACFTNIREAVVPTAAHANARALAPFAAAAGIGIMAALALRRRRG